MVQLSKRGETILRLAKQIATEYQQKHVGTEHLLLAIFRDGTGSAVRILEHNGATEARVRQEIDKLLDARLQETWIMGRVPGSPYFRDVLRRASEEARGMGNWQVGSFHLLIGLLSEQGSTAYSALRTLGITLDKVRRHVVQLGAG